MKQAVKSARIAGAGIREISKGVWEGLHDPDPERRAQWGRIPCAGDVPTPEEWLRYSVERLKEDGREDLLRHYLID